MSIESNPKHTTTVKEFKKALLIGFYLKNTEKDTCLESLEELERLADTYGVEAIDKVACPLKKISAATILGKGKLQELSALAAEFYVDVMIFDEEISPNQQRNLEKIFKKPVLDRTELIIEVFSQRAQTREARLQVEMAKIKYELPRLKRLWTHLSRQVAGGGGYLKGEGEKQIELDRRILQHRLDRLQKEVEQVRQQRTTMRHARMRSGIPTFAIVGYTNVGKSTLLHALTKAEVLIEDKLFATLDTTTRKFILPTKEQILLVDTVGFIRKIPHTLIAAFKSTLEEAIHTDVLVHLIDVSNPHALEQAQATIEVLKELGAGDKPMITALNKVDACDNNVMLQKLRITYAQTIPISALKGSGFDQLMERMHQAIQSLRKKVFLRIPQSQYALVSELMREGRMLHMEYEENDVLMEIEIPTKIEHKIIPFIQHEPII